jgi:FkbM family methyltransferase
VSKVNKFASTIISAVPTPVIEFVSHNQWRSPLLRRVCSWGASWVKGRDGVILNGVAQGLRFNVAGSHSGFILGSHETEVQKALATVLRPGMVYFDAGANVGFFAVLAARLLGPAGRVVCFEPLPDNARQIEHNAALNGFSNITVCRDALGGSNRTETFCTSAEPTWGMLTSVGKAPVQSSGAIEVSVRTLDSLCGPDKLPYPDLIKIDVEGAEAELLEGAAATLAASRPLLIIELHNTNEAVLTALRKLGYHAGVLGSAVPVRDVNWDANIIAAPADRPELLKTMTTFSKGFAAA